MPRKRTPLLVRDLRNVELPVEVGRLTLRNPFIVASGPTTKSAEQIEAIYNYGWAAASMKLCFDPPPYISLEPRYGYFSDKEILLFTAEKRIDLAEGLRLTRAARKRVGREFVLMCNITYAGDRGLDGWVNMAAEHLDAGCNAVELNFGCPNMSFNVALSGGDASGRPQTGASMGMNAEAVRPVVAAVRKAIGEVPLFVKLTPEGGGVARVAAACFEAGADVVSGNANRLVMPPVDLEHPERSVYHLQREISMSCSSGPWCKPMGQRDCYEIRKLAGPRPLVLAHGGVSTWQDAVEYALCGADLIGICTETLLSGYGFLEPLCAGVKKYLRGHRASWRSLRDRVVKGLKAAPDLSIRLGHLRVKDPYLAAPCKAACPHGVPAQAYVRKVAERDFRRAWELVTSKNPLQSVCAYVCAHPCEEACTRAELDEAVRIRDIKRFVLERGAAEGWKPEVKPLRRRRREKVAVVGSGPAGIACAWDLARAGYRVTVFERAAKAGGMLRYGIPRFRLPEKVLDAEIRSLQALGVDIRTRTALGKDFTLEELRKEFRAVFLGLGAQKGVRLGAEGEGAAGLVQAVDWLRRVRSGRKGKVGKRVAVIGGGFTAVDAARTAKRLGAREVFILYRRTAGEMPATREEVAEAEAEGVRVMYLVSPVSVEPDAGRGRLRLRMVAHVLGRPDASGRRRPEAVTETRFSLTAETVVAAVSQELDAEGLGLLARTARGAIRADESTGATNLRGVFAGGDATTGPDTVIAAVAAGARAAAGIDRFLAKKRAVLTPPPALTRVEPADVLARLPNAAKTPRVPVALRPAGKRARDWELPSRTMTEKEAVREASRCLACGCGEGCEVCRRLCTNFAASTAEIAADHASIDEAKCVGCGMCMRRCPNRNIEAVATSGYIKGETLARRRGRGWGVHKGH